MVSDVDDLPGARGGLVELLRNGILARRSGELSALLGDGLAALSSVGATLHTLLPRFLDPQYYGAELAGLLDKCTGLMTPYPSAL